VLIALVIVAASSAIILAHLRTLMDLNVRLRKQQTEVTQILNRVAAFPLFDFTQARLKTTSTSVEVYAVNGEKIVTVKNHMDNNDSTPPPVNKIYTAYQKYIFNSQHYQITLLLQGMRYNE